MRRVLPLAGSWIRALSGTLTEAAPQLSEMQIERLRDHVSQFAWRADCPDTRAIAEFFPTEQYSRHVVTSTDSYQALLIVWPPNFETALHDHDGLWGIELVLDGTLGVEEFHASRTRTETTLAQRRSLALGAGDAAIFTGVDYVHKCRNLSANQPALSLHIYGGDLASYQTYFVDRAGGYRVTSSRAQIDTVRIESDLGGLLCNASR